MHRDRRRFAVADFADEDDIGILAQHRPQCGCESETRLFVNLHLHDSGNPIFDRIFDSDDVHAAMLQKSEGGVQRCRFSRARRTGDEDQSFAHVEQLLHPRPIDRIETERFHRAQSGPRVQNADHDLFSVRCRQR